MPKRKRSVSSDGDFKSISKRLKKLERELKEKRCRRSRNRIVESSSTSRESSASRELFIAQDGDSERNQDAISEYSGSAPLSDPIGAHAGTSRASPAPLPPDAALPPLADAAPPPADDTPPADPLASPIDAETALDSLTLQILGDDPTAKIQYGKEVHKEIASRFEHLSTTGLDKETRKEMIGKYLIPSNCVGIGAPLLNAEIKAALPESVVKRDVVIEVKQKQLAAAISCLAETITEQLNSKEVNHDLLKRLMDATRLLCDVQHTDSVSRRNFALYSLKRDMKEHLTNTKIDKYLFGEDVSNTLKTAKAVNKLGTDLKAAYKIPKKSQSQNMKPQQSKNWKNRAPARRPLGAQKERAPAAPHKQAANLSRRSPPRSRTTHRR